MSITSRLLSNIKPTQLAVKIEKASADPSTGLAKVVFSTNRPAQKSREFLSDTSALSEAFYNVFGDKAHYVDNSAHASEKDGLYYGFVKTNTPVVEHADAVKEGSGYHLVAANVFADDADNIWDVREVAGRKVLMRNSQEDLMELFNITAPSANMSVAAATMQLTSKLEFASVVTYMDVSETYQEGIVLDTSTVYNPVKKKAEVVSAVQVVAASNPVDEVKADLASCMKNDHATFQELAAADVQAVYDYLDRLYARAPAFLAAYKAAVRRLINQ